MSSQDSAIPPQNAREDLWNDPAYTKRYTSVEDLTGRYAHDLLTQMNLQNHSTPLHFLDLACGSGVVTDRAITILHQSDPNRDWSSDKFTAADLSPEMLKIYRSQAEANKWPVSEDTGTLEVTVADMTDNKLPSDTYTHLGCTFGPCNAPDPDKTLRECFRVLRPGGSAGWASWQVVGWWFDMRRAINDIRADAARKCNDGTGSAEDQKLSKYPTMGDFSDLASKFAGVDVAKLRREGTPEPELPRWDREDWFKSRLEKAGFVDVKIEIAQKTMVVDLDSVSQMLYPLFNILGLFMTEQQKKDTEGADLSGAVGKWLEKRFQEADVKDGKVLWDQWYAMVITARKPE